MGMSKEWIALSDWLQERIKHEDAYCADPEITATSRTLSVIRREHYTDVLKQMALIESEAMAIPDGK